LATAGGAWLRLNRKAETIKTMLQKLRQAVGRRLIGDRIRLGGGDGLQPITEQELEQMLRLFPRPKFFIFGHKRSGTTLLGRLMRLHPEVHCNWQGQFFSRIGPVPIVTAPAFLNWLQRPSNHWSEGHSPALLVRLYSDYLMEAGAENAGKRWVGDKSTNGNGAQAIRWLYAVYPDASLIYIVRDGRDTLLSKRVQSFIDQPHYLNGKDRRLLQDLQRDYRPFVNGERSLFSPTWLREASLAWAENVKQSAVAGKELFGGRFISVRFEDLLSSPQDQMHRLWNFLGAGEAGTTIESDVTREMDQNPAAEWHESTGAEFVKHLPRGQAGAWEQVFTRQDREIFSSIADPVMHEWGYS
jgi:hypothetical protein